MTLSEMYSLRDAIQQALDATGDGTTAEVTRWLQLHRRDVLNANSLTIEREGLSHIIREYRKKEKSTHETISLHQFCMDFGLPDIDLDLEISVPRTVDGNPSCEWIDLEDATVDDLDAHEKLLEAKAAETLEKARNIRLLRNSAAQIVPNRTDIPMRELRRIARGEVA